VIDLLRYQLAADGLELADEWIDRLVAAARRP
jgi:hypothetical protein